MTSNHGLYSFDRNDEQIFERHIPTATNLRRGDTVVYIGDDGHFQLTGTVIRVGLEVLGEPAVEVVFRHGRTSSRKQIRVSKLARAEAVTA